MPAVYCTSACVLGIFHCNSVFCRSLLKLKPCQTSWGNAAGLSKSHEVDAARFWSCQSCWLIVWTAWTGCNFLDAVIFNSCVGEMNIWWQMNHVWLSVLKHSAFQACFEFSLERLNSPKLQKDIFAFFPPVSPFRYFRFFCAGYLRYPPLPSPSLLLKHHSTKVKVPVKLFMA